MTRVAVVDAPGSLDFDEKEPVRQLDDEVHFCSAGRTPMEHVGARGSRTCPSHEIGQQKVLQVDTPGGSLGCKVHGKPRVAPVDLRGLDEAAGAVDRRRMSAKFSYID